MDNTKKTIIIIFTFSFWTTQTSHATCNITTISTFRFTFKICIKYQLRRFSFVARYKWIALHHKTTWGPYIFMWIFMRVMNRSTNFWRWFRSVSFFPLTMYDVAPSAGLHHPYMSCHRLGSQDGTVFITFYFPFVLRFICRDSVTVCLPFSFGHRVLRLNLKKRETKRPDKPKNKTQKKRDFRCSPH